MFFLQELQSWYIADWCIHLLTFSLSTRCNRIQAAEETFQVALRRVFDNCVRNQFAECAGSIIVKCIRPAEYVIFHACVTQLLDLKLWTEVRKTNFC